MLRRQERRARVCLRISIPRALAKRRAQCGAEAARQLHEAQKAMETPSVLARIERDRAEKLADIDREVYTGFLREKVIAEIGAKIAPLSCSSSSCSHSGAGHVDPHDAAIADLDEQFRQEWISKLEEREQELRAREIKNRELRAMMIEECDLGTGPVACCRNKSASSRTVHVGDGSPLKSLLG